MLNKASHWPIGVFLGFCLLCVSGPAAAETFQDRIESGGRERSFIVVVPESAKRGERLPTVIALHGALMSGTSMKKIFGMDGLAERDKFAVVYPDGVRRRWNDGREGAGRPDDVRFIRRLAEHLVRSGLADPKRLYLVGVSNGGMLTYRVACEAPGVFAAYAAVIANMPERVAEDCPARGGGAPMLIINATDDPVVPWEGGEIGRFRRQGEVLSTPDTVRFWRRYNKCSEKSQMKPLPDKDRTDGSTVLARQFGDCQSDAAVVLLTVEGGGHLPPGADIGNRPLLQSILGGPANQDISAADVSWKFFKRFPLPPN